MRLRRASHLANALIPPFLPSRGLQGADEVQQDDDDDRHAGQPQDDVAEHGGGLLQATGRRVANTKWAGTDASRCCPPFSAAHQAAAKAMIRPAAVTKPVRTAARLALSAAARAALTASSTRRSASCWEMPERWATSWAR